MKRLPGFTLVELLVVIAIISLLASILLPVFGRAKERGRQSACLSNLRQIGMTINAYADEHQEMFPDAVTVWDDLQITEKRVLECPSQPSTSNHFTIGYTYSGFLAGHCRADVKNPTGEILCADGNETAFSSPDGIDFRHSNGCNACFCDGHVEYLTELPPMWEVHLLGPEEFESEVKTSAYPVVLCFYNRKTDSNGEVDLTQPEVRLGEALQAKLKELMSQYRLQAKFVVVDFPLENPSSLQEQETLVNDLLSVTAPHYPLVLLFPRGDSETFSRFGGQAVTPPNGDDTPESWYTDEATQLCDDIAGELRNICNSSTPWIRKEAGH